MTQPLLNPDLAQRLQTLVRSAPHLMTALVAVRQLGLGSWCIGAGAVRTVVWDALHGFETPTSLDDVDVVYYDPAPTPARTEEQLQSQLSAWMPGPRWEATNQATVHHWFLEHLGQSVAPLHSLEDGVATWPEFATCVGVSLGADDSLRIVAPHGLEDLFALRVRHNPLRASAATYKHRIAQKQFSQRWPRVAVLPA